MKKLFTCRNFSARFRPFVYAGMHESFSPPPDSAGKNVKPKELDHQQKLDKAKSDMESKINAAKENLEQKFEKGGADAAAKEAKDSIGKSRDSIVSSIGGFQFDSGPQAPQMAAAETCKTEVKNLAKTAMDDIDKAAKLFKGKKEYAEIDSHLKVSVQPKYETLDQNITIMGGWQNFDTTVTSKEEMATVKGYLSQLTTIVNDGGKIVTEIDANIAKLNKLKGLDPQMDKDIDHYVTKVLNPARKRADEGVKSARKVYNEKLGALQKGMKDSMDKAKGKVTEYQNESGVAQMKMDRGQMSKEDRMAAYNKYRDQQSFIADLKAYSTEVGGMKPLSGDAKPEPEKSEPEPNT